MPTIELSRQRIKKERVQIHWDQAPGLAAKAYNVKRGTSYDLVKKAGTWTCTCVWATNFSRGESCKHIIAVIDKALREGLEKEGTV